MKHDMSESAALGGDLIPLEVYERERDEHALELLRHLHGYPQGVFTPEGFSRLGKLPSETRFSLLKELSKYLAVTPAMASAWFEQFPEDLRRVEELFREHEGGWSGDPVLNDLFVISIDALVRGMSDATDRYSSEVQSYKQIAQRKEKAPEALLKGFPQEETFGERFQKFGVAAEGFLAALQEASVVGTQGGDYRFDAAQMFTPAYETLSDEDKAEFLRNCLAALQHHLVFIEVYLSSFTEDEAAQQRQALADRRDRLQFAGLNVAHSMLYRTPQPVTVRDMPDKYFNAEMDSTEMRGGFVEEYPYHRLILAVLDRLKGMHEGKKENAEVTVDFWNKNRNPIFGNRVASALSEQDSQGAARTLLGLIREEKIDKRPLAAVLYRLEFGKIGISEEGVRYLEKVYDTSEYNNPAFHASRLTAQGEIGIFDEHNALLGYFPLNLESDEQRAKAAVLKFTTETLFIPRTGETEEQRQKRLQYIEEFKQHYYVIAGDAVFKDTGVRLNNLSLREQGWFLLYFKEANAEQKERLRGFVAQFGEEGMKTFLAMEHGWHYGETILELAGSAHAPEIFQQFNLLIDNGLTRARETVAVLAREHPDLPVDEQHVMESMLARGKDLLREAGYNLIKGDEGKVKLVITSLCQESEYQNLLRVHFSEIADALSQDHIDLSAYQYSNIIAKKTLEDPSIRSLLFRALNALDRLSPIPEIHWRVDRTTEEYERRTGLQLSAFLENRGRIHDCPSTLLEIGPGSGVSREERARSMGEGYKEFGLSDRLYYPLAPIFEKLIDFDRLGKDAGSAFTVEEKRQLADFLYKVGVIARGQTAEDRFSYDEKNMKLLASDVNALKNLLPDIFAHLQYANTVPNVISSRDEHGQVTYPNKIRIGELSPLLQKVKVLLQERGMGYLRSDWQEIDYYRLIEAFPPNVIIGDMRELTRIELDQLDVVLGVRSTVYLREKEYVEFLKTVEPRLRKGGIMIDDSVRDNDGWYYRIAELIEAKQGMEQDTEILVMLGPGFPGEDFRQDEVPLALVMTKSGSSRRDIEQYVLQDCRVISLEDLQVNADYLATLDKDGKTKQRVEGALSARGGVA